MRRAKLYKALMCGIASRSKSLCRSRICLSSNVFSIYVLLSGLALGCQNRSIIYLTDLDAQLPVPKHLSQFASHQYRGPGLMLSKIHTSSHPGLGRMGSLRASGG